VQNTGKNYYDYVGSRDKPLFTFFRSYFLVHNTWEPGENWSRFLFASSGTTMGANETLYITDCGTRTTYVDANVTCISKGALGRATCGVDAIRESPDPPEHPNVTVMGTIPFGYKLTEDFMNILGPDQFSYTQSTDTENYLADPLTAFVALDPYRTRVELGQLDIKTFERRLSLLMNTLWKIMWAQKTVMGGELPRLENLYAQPGQFDWDVELLHNTTSSIVFPVPAVYAIDRPWLAVYFISVCVMFCAAVFALVMRALCRAPTVLGYVSSLVRDSSYFIPQAHGATSAEDGPEKSMRLGAMRVMVGDVGRADGEVGRIAFAPAEAGKRVAKGKWYD
jgi:hypothetical protein